MWPAREDSQLQQHGLDTEDFLDDDFPPEELRCCILVQHLLAPERFLRVLIALRVTLKDHCKTGNLTAVDASPAAASPAALLVLTSAHSYWTLVLLSIILGVGSGCVCRESPNTLKATSACL